MATRVIVCGGREFCNWERLSSTLSCVRDKYPDLLVVHGACRGADLLAKEWAKENGVPHEPHPADWSRGRRGGPERNQRMADLGDVGLVAFRGGFGTRNMIGKARKAGIPVWEIQ